MEDLLFCSHSCLIPLQEERGGSQLSFYSTFRMFSESFETDGSWFMKHILPAQGYACGELVDAVGSAKQGE